MGYKLTFVIGLLGLVGAGCSKTANTSASCGASGMYASSSECGAGCSMTTVNSAQGSLVCWGQGSPAPSSTPVVVAPGNVYQPEAQTN